MLMFSVKFHLQTGYNWSGGNISLIKGEMKAGITYSAFYFRSLIKKGGNSDNLTRITNWIVKNNGSIRVIGKTESGGGYILIEQADEGDIIPLATGITTNSKNIGYGVRYIQNQGAWDDVWLELTGFLVPMPL